MYSIEHINYIKAPASVLYKALTTREGLAQIWTKKLNVEPEADYINEFDFDEGYITRMKIIELHESNRIIWKCIASDKKWVGTNISFELSEEKGITTIVLKQDNWRELTDFYRWCNYNWAMFLYRLKAYCENQ